MSNISKNTGQNYFQLDKFYEIQIIKFGNINNNKKVNYIELLKFNWFSVCLKLISNFLMISKLIRNVNYYWFDFIQINNHLCLEIKMLISMCVSINSAERGFLVIIRQISDQPRFYDTLDCECRANSVQISG